MITVLFSPPARSHTSTSLISKNNNRATVRSTPAAALFPMGLLFLRHDHKAPVRGVVAASGQRYQIVTVICG